MLGIDSSDIGKKIDLLCSGNHDTQQSRIMYDNLVRNKGILLRSVDRLFVELDKLKDEGVNYRITCSYIEIYNEKLYDLLDYKNKSALEIREDEMKQIVVPNLTRVEISHPHHVYVLIKEGNLNRVIGSTDMNERSSRSHTIFQLNIMQERNGSKLESKLNLTDLAGSEKWNVFSRYKMSDTRILEMTSINKSLTTLGKCIFQLRKGNSHIPYRESKLTRLLQDSLGGNCRTAFFFTVTPSENSFEESLSTFKFALRAMKVVVNTSVNVSVIDNETLLRQYENELMVLKNTAKGKDRRLTILEEQLKRERDLNKTLTEEKNDKKQKDIKLEDGVEHEYLLQKLKQIQSIEEQQNEREKQLENYHKWLYSIPVLDDGEKYTITISKKMELVENTLREVNNEKEGMQKQFLEERKVLMKEIRKRDEKTERMKKFIDKQGSTIAELQMKIRTLPNAKKEKLNDKKNRFYVDVNEFKKREIVFKEVRKKLNKETKECVRLFRTNIIRILSDHVTELELDRETREEITEEFKQLIEGGTEALEESVVEKQNELHSVVYGLLKSLLPQKGKGITKQPTESKEVMEKLLLFANIFTGGLKKVSEQFNKYIGERDGRTKKQLKNDLKNGFKLLFQILDKFQESIKKKMETK